MSWVLLFAAVLATVPVRLFLRADISREPTFEVVVYVYGFRVQFEGLLEEGVRMSLRRGKRSVQLPLRTALRAFARLWESASPVRADIACRVGTGEACATALTAAGLRAGLGALAAPLGARVRVEADFRKPCFALRARCILCFRGGDIIRAGVLALAQGAPNADREGHAHGTASH